MAGSVNKAILIGNLGKDPDIRTMQSGDRVATLALATSESWKDKTTGEKKERTEWHRITVFNKGLVDICEKYLKKGAKIYIEGQLQTRKWTDQSNIDRYTTEVVLKPFNGEMHMLSGNRSGNEPPPPDSTESYNYGGQSHNSPPPDNLDDEIPF